MTECDSSVTLKHWTQKVLVRILLVITKSMRIHQLKHISFVKIWFIQLWQYDIVKCLNSCTKEQETQLKWC